MCVCVCVFEREVYVSYYYLPFDNGKIFYTFLPLFINIYVVIIDIGRGNMWR